MSVVLLPRKIRGVGSKDVNGPLALTMFLAEQDGVGYTGVKGEVISGRYFKGGPCLSTDDVAWLFCPIALSSMLVVETRW